MPRRMVLNSSPPGSARRSSSTLSGCTCSILPGMIGAGTGRSSTRSSGRHCRPRLACRRGTCRCLLWLGRGSGAAAASADDCERSPESRPERSCGACAFGVHGSFLPEVRATSTRSPPRSGFLAAKCSVGVSGGSSASLRPPTGEKLTVVRSPGHEGDAPRRPAMAMKARPFTHGSPRPPGQRNSRLLRPADEARPFTHGCPRPPVQRDPILWRPRAPRRLGGST